MTNPKVDKVVARLYGEPDKYVSTQFEPQVQEHLWKDLQSLLEIQGGAPIFNHYWFAEQIANYMDWSVRRAYLFGEDCDWDCRVMLSVLEEA